MNYCPNCGNKLPEGAAFCTKCGSKVGNSTIPNQQDSSISPEDNEKANKLTFISLGLFFGPGILSSLIAIPGLSKINSSVIALLSSVSGLCGLAAIVLMIITRVKYPKHKLSKIIIWVIVGLVVVSILAGILFVLACMYTCRNC